MHKKSNEELRRLEVLHALEVMDSLPEQMYDDITSLASSLCGTPISLITLLDDKKQFMKSHHGIDQNEMPIALSFCKHLLDADNDRLIIEDVRQDARFKHNPAVLGHPHISFYAGISLTWSNGVRLGSLCVIDDKPRKLTKEQIRTLEVLAKQVVHLLELRISKKEAERKKEALENIMSSSLDLICTIDRKGIILQISDACLFIGGYEPKELLGRNYMDFVFSEDTETTQNLFDATVAGNKTLNFENRFIHKNGSLVWVSLSANWDEQNEIMYCVLRDITEKKKIIHELETSEQRFKTLVQEGSDLIAILDEEANYKYVSPTSQKILQIKPEEFIGTNAFEYIHPDDQESILTQFKEVLQKHQGTIKPFRFKDKEGNWRWVETIITNQMEEPSINGIVANSRDVTERVSYLKAIEDQNTKLKKIAWTQSHVLRAPVARLMGLTELLNDQNLQPNESKEILGYIVKSAEEIDAVIKNIVENSAYNFEWKDLN